MKKPPMGLTPYRVWWEENPDPDLHELIQRYEEVCAAILKRRESGKKVPGDWLFEVTGAYCLMSEARRVDDEKLGN